MDSKTSSSISSPSKFTIRPTWATNSSRGRSAGSVRKQAYSATGISLLAALFIILTTLSMGVPRANSPVRRAAGRRPDACASCLDDSHREPDAGRNRLGRWIGRRLGTSQGNELFSRRIVQRRSCYFGILGNSSFRSMRFRRRFGGVDHTGHGVRRE